MPEIRTRGEIKHGWWIETRATIPCAVDKEGFLAIFFRADAEKLMDECYPHEVRRGQKIWWFNDTFDREIAEVDADNRIVTNVQVLLRHFMTTAA